MEAAFPGRRRGMAGESIPEDRKAAPEVVLVQVLGEVCSRILTSRL